MPNVKAQISNQIQSSNIKISGFELWHSFDIWILNFDIFIYSVRASIASMI
jgi:hypothetical protein